MEKEFVEMFEQKSSVKPKCEIPEVKRLNRIIKHYDVKEGNQKCLSAEKSVQMKEPSATLQNKPTIKINKNGDVIKQIEVICSCGEIVFIDLEYD